MSHPNYTHGIHYYLSCCGSACSPTLACPISPALMWARDLSALCPRVHCTSPGGLCFSLFLLSSRSPMNPPNTSSCFWKSPAIPIQWAPCQSSKLGLKVLCCPTFKNYCPHTWRSLPCHGLYMHPLSFKHYLLLPCSLFLLLSGLYLSLWF